ncbi:hypothetical protein CHS0354_013471 [Potamilus streckersoni]|uniref:Uncharacterized protein n=1 Tax=Potamilus streckersoni TaxID=2493646 RepID=A0AAE0T987_9BIVA|nr:hypothetical protein CHS0354_013471 [Potamilus streckersoni]
MYCKMNHDQQNKHDKTLTVSLLNLSDQSKYSQTSNLQHTLKNDWSEAVSGWKPVVPYPCYVNQSTTVNGAKKRKDIDRSLTDLQPTSHGRNDFANFSFSESFDSKYVRCVDDDFENLPVPPWKLNIEQGTYRYIPNSGSYRTLKFMSDDRKDWYTIRKKFPEKLSSSWHHSCKRIQREIKRQLKRDMENQRKTPNGTRKNEQENSEYLNKFEMEKLFYKQEKESRARSSQSEGANRLMQTITEDEIENHTHSTSIPAGGQLIKSVSDLFIENFSSRINALEKEMRHDSRVVHKNGVEDISKIVQKQYRDRAKESKENTPRLPYKAETLTQDIFSVKKVGHRDLNPLERVGSYRYVGQGDGIPYPQTYLSSELEKTLNSYKSSLENTKLSPFNTHTATKVINKRSSKTAAMPATVTISENNSFGNNQDRSAGDSSHNETKNSASNKKKAKKGPLPGILPEISGRKMEVTPISHRLL